MQEGVPSVCIILLWLFVSDSLFLGLRDVRRFHTEASIPFFPFDFPDTPAYQAMVNQDALEKAAKHARTPAGKRVNFEKLGISSPFIAPWNSLLQADVFYVLRGSRVQQLLPSTHRVQRSAVLQPSVRLQWVPRSPSARLDSSILVRVAIKMARRGSPMEHAMIYAIRQSDLSAYHSASDWYGTELHDDHTVVGYLTSGIFSFIRGRGSGVGFVVANEIQQIQRVQQTGNSSVIVLIRNTTSLFLRPAFATICS